MKLEMAAIQKCIQMERAHGCNSYLLLPLKAFFLEYPITQTLILTLIQALIKNDMVLQKLKLMN